MDDCDEGKRIGSSCYHYCRAFCLNGALCGGFKIG